MEIPVEQRLQDLALRQPALYSHTNSSKLHPDKDRNNKKERRNCYKPWPPPESAVNSAVTENGTLYVICKTQTISTSKHILLRAEMETNQVILQGKYAYSKRKAKKSKYNQGSYPDCCTPTNYMLNPFRIFSDGYQTNDSSACHADKHNKIAHCPYQSCPKPLTHWLNKERTNAKNNLYHKKYEILLDNYLARYLSKKR